MERHPVRLVVGLGNPGPKYEETRHNVGFWLVDELTRQGRTSFRSEQKMLGEVCQLRLDGHELRLLKPMTYMNHSGQAIGAMARFYRIPVEEILVVHDELDLDPGAIRLKRGGGHGGHNGLRDAIAHLGGKDFARLRIGIGHPGDRSQVTPWVLGRPGVEARIEVERAIERALGLMPVIVRGDFQVAMNQLHSA